MVGGCEERAVLEGDNCGRSSELPRASRGTQCLDFKLHASAVLARLRVEKWYKQKRRIQGKKKRMEGKGGCLDQAKDSIQGACRNE